MANADGMLRVEVAAAFPGRQVLECVEIAAGSTVEEAIRASGIAGSLPGFDVAGCEVAIWGRRALRDAVLGDGDRVELLRPLQMDPREARRRLASEGGFMGPASKDGT